MGVFGWRRASPDDPPRSVPGDSTYEDALARGYRECARITRRFGTTYFWGAALLPVDDRRHVHAIYSVCRLADDVVDEAGPDADRHEVRRRLQDLADEFYRVCEAPAPGGSEVLLAAANSVRERDIPRENFERFFAAMSRDLTNSAYDTWDDLLAYMEGSAAVIGEMMLPVLLAGGSRARLEAATEPARQLGFAFQLTNFLRDVGEDLDRGRVYLPREDLDRFGVDIASREVTPEWKRLMAFQIERNRELYRRAEAGIPLLPGPSARCVRAAHRLYAEILDRIEEADYDVFTDRARVPTGRKVAVAALCLAGR